MPEGWFALPAPPSPRARAATVWAAGELLVIGGDTDFGGTIHISVFGFDPQAGVWRCRSDAPFPVTGQVAVSTGELVYAIGDGVAASYDPAADRWLVLPAPPAAVSASPVAVVWSGRELVVWGDRGRAVASIAGAAYNPERQRWRTLPEAPFAINEGQAAWTGDELIVYGAQLDGSNVSATAVAVGMAFDPINDLWRELPPVGLSPQAVSVVWAGDMLVVWDYLLEAGAYHPDIDDWTVLPDLPLTFSECPPDSAALTGGRVFAWYCGQAALYEPATAGWVEIATPATAGEDPARIPGAPVAAGSSVYFAGAGHGGQPDAAWRWQPLADEAATPWQPVPDAIEVRPLELEVPVPVRLLAVRINSPRLAVIDLDRGEVALYPPGSHGLPGDAISGALVMADGSIVIWQDDTVRVFTDSLVVPILEYTPAELINPAYAAPAIQVVPAADGDSLWVVQLGSCCPDHSAGLAELVELATGQVRTRVELPSGAWAAAMLGESLLLNTERLLPPDPDADEADAGWSVIAPGSQRVLQLTQAGNLADLTAGHAIAVSGDTIVVQSCEHGRKDRTCHLEVLDTATNLTRRLEVDGGGTLSIAGGPDIPGHFAPWQTVAPDGRILASISIHDPSQDTPTESSLATVDPDTLEVTEIASFDGPLPPAAWDRTGDNIVLADGADITVINPINGASFTLNGVVPGDHHIVGLG